jgi:hypothetical protein
VESRPGREFRDWSLEVYAQPFVASAAFDDVGELAMPREFDFLRYGVDAGTVAGDGADLVVDPDGAGPAPSFHVEDEDFNERSLRASTVLRWEWRPGSTLFVVWQHQRSSAARVDHLSLGRDVRALLHTPSENVLELKLSYWLNP